MLLHEDQNSFNDLITQTAEYIGFQRGVICKDYYVMFLLKEIVKQEPNIIFKGGTSLSKAWHVINRFSEDIDLTYGEKIGGSRRNGINKKISQIIVTYGFVDNSKRKFNKNEFRKFEVEYQEDNDEVTFYNKDVIIESAFQIVSYPYEIKTVSSYITEYLNSISRNDIIEKYQLEEFDVNVQTLERTFIDKVFALCDYVISNKIKFHARHIYDLYKIYPFIKFDDTFKILISEVRDLRKNYDMCYSAQDNQNINELLNIIKNENIYKSDYEENTVKYFNKNESLTYEQAIQVIDKIIDSNMFI